MKFESGCKFSVFCTSLAIINDLYNSFSCFVSSYYSKNGLNLVEIYKLGNNAGYFSIYILI